MEIDFQRTLTTVGADLFDLSGRCAVVVGGTSGIGRAISLGLAEAGANTVASSRTLQAVNALADELESAGHRTLRIASDATQRDSLEALHAAVLKEFGRVDILVNCAGITKRVPTLELTEETWANILDINLTGTLRACQIFGRTMLEQGYGRVINIASLSTFVAFRDVAAYGASKAGVGALTKSLAVEWAMHGVCVNAIAPGIFPTDLNRKLLDSPRGHELLMRTPMHRFGDVEELVGPAIFLASEAASFITGQILVVDGGTLASGVNQ
ncbi:SDR family oxidoreductase [Granulicella sp. WH15]|nr:SDR family oxidoreductase [Granulicella sp. WH15]